MTVIGDDEIRGCLGPHMPKLHDYQVDVVRQILDAYAAGKKFVILQAPTGSGKTFIGRAVSKFTEGSTGYTTPSKDLQDQFAHDFPEALVVKGHGEFCGKAADSHADPHRMFSHCEHDELSGSLRREIQHLRGEHRWEWDKTEDLCTYYARKLRAKYAELYVGNFAVLLRDLSLGDYSTMGDRGLLIIDEADELIGALDDAKAAKQISLSTLAELKWFPPEEKDRVPDGVISRQLRDAAAVAQLDVDHWTKVATELRDQLEDDKKALGKLRGKQYDVLTRQMTVTRRELAEAGTQIQMAEELVANVHELAEFCDAMTNENYNRYVYDWTGDGGQALRARYIYPSDISGNLLNAGKRVLMMSASLVAVEKWAAMLGIRSEELAIIEMDSTFPIANRTVHFHKTAPKMGGGKTREQFIVDAQAQVEMITDLLTTHPGRALVLVTSGSSATGLNKALMRESLGREVLVYENGSPRKRREAVDRAARVENSILIGQSAHRGLDLKGDACRLLIVAKMPWFPLGDRLLVARKKVFGNTYYEALMVAKFLQGIGRGVRGETDWCQIHVVDGDMRAIQIVRAMSPKYIREAIVPV